MVLARWSRLHLSDDCRFDEGGSRDAVNSMGLGDQAPPAQPLHERAVDAQAATRGSEDEQGDEHHRVDDPRPHIGRAGDVGAAETLADRPQQQRVDDPNRVTGSARDAEQQQERQTGLRDPGQGREQQRGAGLEFDPDVKPSLAATKIGPARSFSGC